MYSDLPEGTTAVTPVAGASGASGSSTASAAPQYTDLPPGTLGVTPVAGSDDVPGNIGHGSSDQSNTGALARLVGRTGIRIVGGLTADLPSLGYRLATGQGLSDWTPPTERLINATGLQMDPHAGTAMKVADFVAPFVNPFGWEEALTNAPTALAKLGVIGGRVAGAGAAAAGSYVGSDIGKTIGGETGSAIGGALGGMVPGVAGRVIATQAPRIAADPSANLTADIADRNNVPKNFGMLARPIFRRAEQGLSSVMGVGAPITEARQSTIDAILAGKNEAVADINRGPENFIGPPSREAPTSTTAPAVHETGEDLQRAGAQMQADLSAEQDQLENRIGHDTEVDAAPLVQTLRGMVNDRTIAPSDQRAIQSRLNEVQAAMPPPQVLQGQAAYNWIQQNPTGMSRTQQAALRTHLFSDPNASITVPGPQTITYAALKDIRSKLGADLENMPPITGAHHGPVYDAFTERMADAAHQAGVLQDFNTANQRYATASPGLKTMGNPRLDAGGGLELGNRSEQQVGQSFEKAAKAGPAQFQQTLNAVGHQPVAHAVADIVARSGKTGKITRADTFGYDYGTSHPGGEQPSNVLSRSAKGYIEQTNPTSAQRLNDLAYLGQKVNIPREATGTTQSVGHVAVSLEAAKWLAHKLGVIPATLGGLAMAHAIQSEPFLQAMAGRGHYAQGIPRRLAYYAAPGATMRH